MKRFSCAVTLLILTISLAAGATPKQKGLKQKQAKQSASLSAPSLPFAAIAGTGTQGRLAKWIQGTVLGDSGIFEDKFGKVGIGTGTPTSLLTVQGVIETRAGGIKFPDGTVQTTAGLTGLVVPIILTGPVDNGNGVITATNTAAGGPGIFTVGGSANATIGGGSGLLALGGTGGASPNTTPGGVGLVGFGGSASNGNGGTGGSLIGGVSTAGNGGDGLFAVGALGVGTGKKGGRGIVAIPGGGAGGATAGLAGEFLGDVEISGNLAKGGGSFKIDHPLDPENKYLYHSFVESPDMMNIYNGNVTTDHNGEAVVDLPEWFEALNKSFRYQLTVIGTFAQAIVSQKVRENKFVIQTSAPGVEVSWQVTGIRKDKFAERNRIPVEQMKTEEERGSFLHPDAFDQPFERGVQFIKSREALKKSGVDSETNLRK